MKDKGDPKKMKKKRAFKYHFGEVIFICFLSPMNFLTDFVLNTFPQVRLIGNQRYQVPPIRYINLDDKVSHLVRGGLFQLQMRISFPFLRANYFRTSFLIIRTRGFLLSCT